MRVAAVLAVVILLSACSAFRPPVETTITLVCPESVPRVPVCEPCEEWVRPPFDSPESLEIALLSTERALIVCRAVNDGCVKRDKARDEAREVCFSRD